MRDTFVQRWVNTRLRTVPLPTPHQCLRTDCSAGGSPHTLWEASWNKEYHHAIRSWRPWTHRLRRNTRIYYTRTDDRAASDPQRPSRILAHAGTPDDPAPDPHTAREPGALMQRAPPVRDAYGPARTRASLPRSHRPLDHLMAYHLAVSSQEHRAPALMLLECHAAPADGVSPTP